MEFSQYTKTVYQIISKIYTEEISSLIKAIINSYNSANMIFLIGNGGSAANASHFAQDLAKGTRLNLDQHKRIKALSLTDNLSFISALANDDGYDSIFEQQLRTFANPGDLVIAISGSGNSPNIIKAVEWANKNGLKTFGITGFDGGKLRKIANNSLHVPEDNMCTAESVHSILFHFIILELQNYFKNN